MAKKLTPLQREYNKQLRLLQQRIARLMKKGKPFNPEQIEAIKKKKSKPSTREIERLKALRGTKLENKINKPSNRKPKPEAPSEPRPTSTSTPYIPKAITMIERITQEFEELDGWIPENRFKFIGYMNTLTGLWNAVLSHMGYPDEANPAIWTYEDYLIEKEAEIMQKIYIIKHASDDESVRTSFTELFSIVKRGHLTAEESIALSEISETYHATYR